MISSNSEIQLTSRRIVSVSVSFRWRCCCRVSTRSIAPTCPTVADSAWPDSRRPRSFASDFSAISSLLTSERRYRDWPDTRSNVFHRRCRRFCRPRCPTRSLSFRNFTIRNAWCFQSKSKLKFYYLSGGLQYSMKLDQEKTLFLRKLFLSVLNLNPIEPHGQILTTCVNLTWWTLKKFINYQLDSRPFSGRKMRRSREPERSGFRTSDLARDDDPIPEFRSSADRWNARCWSYDKSNDFVFFRFLSLKFR